MSRRLTRANLLAPPASDECASPGELHVTQSVSATDSAPFSPCSRSPVPARADSYAWRRGSVRPLLAFIALAVGGLAAPGSISAQAVEVSTQSSPEESAFDFAAIGEVAVAVERAELTPPARPAGRARRRARRLVWLNPEHPRQWGTGDSDMLEYAPVCDSVYGVRNLAQLATAVDKLISIG